MNTLGSKAYPIIDVSQDGGRWFVGKQSLKPKRGANWGDAEHLAVGLRWDAVRRVWLWPQRHLENDGCAANGSCWAACGDITVVVQRSADGARTFTPMWIVIPGDPDAGADDGDITASPRGAVDVLYKRYDVERRRTPRLSDGHAYFTASTDGGRTWSRPKVVGTSAGWVSFSTDGGQHWSAPSQGPPDRPSAPHIMEVTGAGPREAYVGWLSSSDPRGFAPCLRTLSLSNACLTAKWLSSAVCISCQFGERTAFPGDRLGITTPSPRTLVFSRGKRRRALSGQRFSLRRPGRCARPVMDAAARSKEAGDHCTA